MVVFQNKYTYIKISSTYYIVDIIHLIILRILARKRTIELLDCYLRTTKGH